MLEHEHRGLVDRERGVVDAAREVGVVLEDDGLAPVDEKMRRGGRLLEHRAVRTQVARQDDGAAFLRERHPERADDVLVPAPGVPDVVRHRLAVDRQGVGVEQGQELLEDRGEAAGVEKIFHEVLPRGPQIHEEGCRARQLVEAGERQRDAGAPGEGDQVDDRVGRAADRHVAADRVVEGFRRQDLGGPRPARLRQLDGPPTAEFGERQAPGVGRRDRGVTGERHAKGFSHRGHRGRRPHDHAVAGRAREARLDLAELLVGEPARPPLGPEPAGVGARAELIGAPLAAEHGAAGDHDGGEIGGGGAHEHGGRGLVAPREEHDRVERIGAQALLDVHRHEIPEHHRRGLHQDFAERDGRELEGEAPSAPHAPLDGVCHLSQVRVAVGELGPRVGDADHGTAVEDEIAEPFGLEPRAVDEAVEVVAPEPVAAPERVCCHGNPPDHRL